jgi:hypothetical protein
MFRTARVLVCVLASACVGLAQNIERADSLVGRQVTVLNVYRSSGGVTITRLQTDRDVEAARAALQAALRKYPASFISRVLTTVYVGADLKMARAGEKKGWGGLYRYADKTIFMKFTGDPAVFETIFHHELAHGIHFAYRDHFDLNAWLAANPPGFEYTGVVDSGPPSPEIWQQGFVRPYAMFSLHEDVACVAEGLIGDTDNFVRSAGRFDRINRKARLLIGLYQLVDPVMTVSYFRLQQAEATRAAETAAGNEGGEDAHGRPVVVSAASARGTFLGNFREGDRLTLFYRDGDKPRSKTRLTFAPESPANIALCRRRKDRDEPDLTVLTAVPKLMREKPFVYTFKESCAAVLRMDGETAEGDDRVRFEFQIDRSERR